MSDAGPERPQGVYKLLVQRVSGGALVIEDDVVALEEPLEIRLAAGSGADAWQQTVSVTMRTPGDDLDLVVGFLYAEGIIADVSALEAVQHCGPNRASGQPSNIVKAQLRGDSAPQLERLSRHFVANAACGVCGKTSLEALALPRSPVLDSGPLVPSGLFADLSCSLKLQQQVFSHTGGLHAAGLFDSAGALLVCREDIGRHNAVDKAIGARLRSGQSCRGTLMVVSGRAGFELVQKAIMAEVSVFAAVGAPSSLAVQLAEQHGMTLIGFLRDGRFNIYCHPDRIVL